jgi:hypothetical protein
MEYCTCGKPLEFIEFSLLVGTIPSVLVGCTHCKIKFYITKTELHNIDQMPHMRFDDWVAIKENGKFSLKGKIRKPIMNLLQPKLL